MQVNVISGTTQKIDKKNNFATSPIKEQPKTNEGYAPVTASLWGAKNDNKVAFAYGAFVPNFGGSRPTNNPADLPAIEADTQSGFRLSTLEHPVICPDCGRPVMTKPIYTAVKAELDNTDDKGYLGVIKSHEEFLYPQETKILANLQKTQKKNPDMTIRQIVEAEREGRLDKLEDKQYKIMDKIEEIGEVLPYEDRSKVTGLITTTARVIFERENTYAFQRSKFIELVENLDMKDQKAKAEIMKQAQKLPSSMNNEDAWYCKYGGLDSKKQPYTSRAIAEKLVAPTYTNTDHVHPWNLGGLDATSNFWLMHARCNIIKTDKPFDVWFSEDKENRVTYMHEYLRSTQEAIDASKDPKMHPKYDLYAAKLAKTIYNETNGEVDFTKEWPLPEGYDVPKPAEKTPKSEKENA